MRVKLRKAHLFLDKWAFLRLLQFGVAGRG